MSGPDQPFPVEWRRLRWALLILVANVAGERPPICGKASMIAWLRIGSLQTCKFSPVPSGAFCSERALATVRLLARA